MAHMEDIKQSGDVVDSAIARRREFYVHESDMSAALVRRGLKPEEPNVRVYGRAVMAVFEVAQRGLSAQEFKALVGIVEEFTRDMVKEGGK